MELVGIGFGGYEEIDVLGVADLLEELAAVATRSRGDGEVAKVGFGIEGEISEEELLGVDGVVERKGGELEVDAEEDAAGGAETDGSNVVVGDRGTGEALGGVDKGREELEDGEFRASSHGFGFLGWYYESG